MYRAILTPPEERKVKMECQACKMTTLRKPKCPITGKSTGFEHVCGYRGCRGSLVIVPNPLLGE
jgi:hypothetical protein